MAAVGTPSALFPWADRISVIARLSAYRGHDQAIQYSPPVFTGPPVNPRTKSRESGDSILEGRVNREKRLNGGVIAVNRLLRAD
jgi:hypothetical protein